MPKQEDAKADLQKGLPELIRRFVIPCVLAIVLMRMYGAVTRPKDIGLRSRVSFKLASLLPKGGGTNDTFAVWNERVNQNFLFFDEVRITVRPKSVPPKCTAVIIGVGTTMQPWDYDSLARSIASYGHVVVVVNTAIPVEFPTRPFHRAVVEVKKQLPGWLASESVCKEGPKLWLLGGHSASGQAAHAVVSEDETIADAVFSMDPFRITGSHKITKPGLYWGFDKTSCFFVWKGQAAEAAYMRTDPTRRIFHRITTNGSHGIPQYCHCAFTDHGCPFCHSRTPDTFHPEVADSVNRFITAVASGKWKTVKDLQLAKPTTPITTFMGSDVPE